MGERGIMTNRVKYTLESDKVKRIRVAYFGMHDPARLKY
jgi:hypothetical protein